MINDSANNVINVDKCIWHMEISFHLYTLMVSTDLSIFTKTIHEYCIMLVLICMYIIAFKYRFDS